MTPSATAACRATDLTRVTASATYHRAVSPSTLWATTVAWGMNSEPIDTTHALLVESAISIRDRHAGFLRWELVGKPAHDLHVHESTDVYTRLKTSDGIRTLPAAWLRRADRVRRKRLWQYRARVSGPTIRGACRSRSCRVHQPAPGRACDVMSGAILGSACDRSSFSPRC